MGIYKVIKPRRQQSLFQAPPPPRKGQAPVNKEILTKKVMGKKASDIEERSARAIDLTGNSYIFRARLSPTQARAAMSSGSAKKPLEPKYEAYLFTPQPPPQSQRDAHKQAVEDYILTTKWAHIIAPDLATDPADKPTPDTAPAYTITERMANLPGELEIDFLVYWQGVTLWPILIDGQISHYKTDSQALTDLAKTDGINAALAPYGAFPVTRVPYWLLSNQEDANIYYRRLLA